MKKIAGILVLFLILAGCGSQAQDVEFDLDNGSLGSTRYLEIRAETIDLMSRDQAHLEKWISDNITPDMMTQEFMDAIIESLALKWYMRQDPGAALSPALYDYYPEDSGYRIDINTPGEYLGILELQYDVKLSDQSIQAYGLYKAMEDQINWPIIPDLQVKPDGVYLDKILVFNYVNQLSLNKVDLSDFLLYGPPDEVNSYVYPVGG